MRYEIVNRALVFVAVFVMAFGLAAVTAVAEEAVDAADQAQASEDAASESSASISIDDPDAATFPRRLELATEMHKIRPSAAQVDAAVESVAAQMPRMQADSFKASMRNILNYRAIERISTHAMAETFTVEELEAMLEYYSKPEAQSAQDKFELYQNKISPEIVRMIDQGIMRMRAGDGNSSAP
ncbi:MAG: hypothetical protein ACK4VI_02090 [Alphaproteobacteria bacterium]